MMADERFIISGRPEDEDEYCQVKLACGHWSQRLSQQSSTWDFPMDELYCSECEDCRYIDIHAQAALMADADIPEEWIRWE
jgi:hypothetical protein